jgi:hypothetical protein
VEKEVEERVSNFKADIKNSSSKLELEDTKFEEERERELCMVTD